MSNFITIYKILKALEEAMDYEVFDDKRISPEALKITRERRDRLLIELQEDGYIKGLQIEIHSYIRSSKTICELLDPKITLKGLEYLEDNSMMKKAAGIIKGAIYVIKP